MFYALSDRQLEFMIGFAATKCLGYTLFSRALREDYTSTFTRACTLDFRGRIQSDWICPNCEYNLRGLERGGNCPECGARIQTTLISGDKNQHFLLTWPLTLGVLRTLMGILIGFSYWQLMTTVSPRNLGSLIVCYVCLAPIAAAEWFLLIWLTQDQKLKERGLAWRWSWRGVICCYLLDPVAAGCGVFLWMLG